MLDTNVLVSSALQEGVPATAVDMVLAEHLILISAEVLEEYTSVLGRLNLDRFVDLSIRDALVARIAVESTFVPIVRRIAACRDPKDDKFLELAANGDADLIISGDQDLLSLRVFENTPILTAAEFIEANGMRSNGNV